MTAAASDLPDVVTVLGIAMPADVARRLDVEHLDGGPGAPPPAPGPSLVAGSIGRSLTDAAAAYRAQLEDLWPCVVEALPDD